MTRLIDLQNAYECEHGESVWNDSPRVRFNWGFDDGMEAEESQRKMLWSPKVIENAHPDPVYVAGHFAGRENFRRTGRRAPNSTAAWELALGKYDSDVRKRAHLFIVETRGEPGDLQLAGASIPGDELAQLLHYETVAVEDRIGDGVILARNQEGVMVEIMLDVDEQTPIVSEVELSEHGVRHLHKGHALRDLAPDVRAELEEDKTRAVDGKSMLDSWTVLKAEAVRHGYAAVLEHPFDCSNLEISYTDAQGERTQIFTTLFPGGSATTAFGGAMHAEDPDNLDDQRRALRAAIAMNENNKARLSHQAVAAADEHELEEDRPRP